VETEVFNGGKPLIDCVVFDYEFVGEDDGGCF
jgi:hypothetical protein